MPAIPGVAAPNQSGLKAADRHNPKPRSEESASERGRLERALILDEGEDLRPEAPQPPSYQRIRPRMRLLHVPQNRSFFLSISATVRTSAITQ